MRNCVSLVVMEGALILPCPVSFSPGVGSHYTENGDAPRRPGPVRSYWGDRRLPVNKREAVLSLISGETAPSFVPAAFFLHFDRAHHRGQAAIDRQRGCFPMRG